MQRANTGFFTDIDGKTHCAFDVEERRNTCTFSALHTPHSIKLTRRSSLSRKDMWQPKHSANDIVSIFILVWVLIIIFLRDVFLQANFTDGVLIINALPDRYLVTLLFDQNGTDRTDICRKIGYRNRTVGQFAARELTIRCASVPRPAMANTFFPSTSRLARTHKSHKIQRPRSSRIAACEASISRC